jgi:hypothetical protein
MPSQDSWWYHNVYLLKNPTHQNPLGGLHSRKVDMKGYNAEKAYLEWRTLQIYSARGSLPQLPDTVRKAKKPKYPRKANLHAIAHIYASDRNSLFVNGNHLDMAADARRIATISHTVIFHVGIKQLLVSNEPTDRQPATTPTQIVPGSEHAPGSTSKSRKWYVQEIWTNRAEGGRSLHNSRLWDPDTGVHLATTIQDRLVRFKDDSSPPKL